MGLKLNNHIVYFSQEGKMSNVRLSNGSPTLGRVDARLSDNPKSSACKNLFGPVDHEELKKDLKGRLQEMEEAASARWNFDFSNHKPLPNGRYNWQAVDDSPIFYTSLESNVTDSCPSGNTNVDLNGNHNCVVVTNCKQEEKAERSENQMDIKDQCNGQRKRPACHGKEISVRCFLVLAKGIVLEANMQDESTLHFVIMCYVIRTTRLILTTSVAACLHCSSLP